MITPRARTRVVADLRGTSRWPVDDPHAFVYVRHAERARALEVGTTVDYYWQHADSRVDRVRLEVCAASTGSVAVLVAEPAALPWSLSRRELEVLTCLACGMTNPQISAHLFVARSTVSTHVEHILDKLGVSTRSGAVAGATAHGAILGPLPAGADSLGVLSYVVSGSQTSVARPPFPRGSDAYRYRGRPAPIRLGSVYPHLGADDAQAMRDGAQLAIESINRAGGIHGRAIEHLVVSTGFEVPSTLGDVIAELRALDVNAITTAPLASDHEEGSLAELAEIGVPVLHSMVSPGLSRVSATGRSPWNNVLQVCGSEDNYLYGFARTVALSDSASEIADRGVCFVVRRPSLTAAFRADIDRLNDELSVARASCVDVPDGLGEWAAAARHVSEQNPAAVFVMTYTEHSLVTFLQEARRLGFRGLVYTTWAPSITGLLTRHRDLLDGVYWATLIGLYDNPVTTRFRDEFVARFGRDPGLGSAAIHFDMVQLLRQAWVSSGNPWNTEQVVRALRSQVYRGVAGSYFMGGPRRRGLTYPDDTGDLSIAHAHLVYQIRSGSNHLVAPHHLVAGTGRSSDG